MPTSRNKTQQKYQPNIMKMRSGISPDFLHLPDYSHLQFFYICRNMYIYIILNVCNNSIRSRGSSVSIVSGYRLDDRAIEVQSPAEAEDFSFSLFVQTGSGAHPASCTMGTGGPFPGGKARPGRDADHSPHLVPRS
jgi:hypothetical protein